MLRGEADRVVVVDTPDRFLAVGSWYRDFRQVSDDEVRSLVL
jgi:putative phosphoribosyl transferase